MSVSAQAITSLRNRTGVSILECKKALEEAKGDEEKAIEILRKRGIAQAAKKADRAQSEGGIFIVEANGKAGLVLIKCETDFVARDDSFITLGTTLAKTLAEQGKEKAEAEAETLVPAAVQKLGENISVGLMKVIEAPVTGSYVHSNRKIGVLIGMEGGSAEIAKDIAMHAAAMSPAYINPDQVTAEAVAKEKDIWTEQLSKEGKPADIVEKIMLGKEKKFREENALVTQPFVKDPSKTVQQYAGSGKVTHYERITTAD